MRVDCALLCDAATVREGLLHILGGGVTLAFRPTYPAPTDVTLALRVMVHPTETSRGHSVSVQLVDSDGGSIAGMDLGFGVANPATLVAGEEASLALCLRFPPTVTLPKADTYSYEVLIDGNHHASLTLKVVDRPPPGLPTQPQSGPPNPKE